MRRWRLLAGAAVGLAVACSDGGDAGPAPREQGAGPYVVPAAAPDGWSLEQVARAGSDAVKPRVPHHEDLAVFVPEHGDGAVVARRLQHVPWGEDDQPQPAIDVGATDGRRVVEHPYARGRYLVDRYGQLVETWAEGAAPSAALDLATVVEPDLTLPGGAPMERIAVLPGAWASTGSAVQVVLRQDDSGQREWVTTVSVTGAEAEALRLLLVDEPPVSFRTESSVYELERYPVAAQVEDGIWQGMLGPWTAALVIDGDPGIAVLVEATDAEDARAGLELAQDLAALLRRHTGAELEALAEELRDRQWEAARRHALAGRDLIWDEPEDDDGRTRILVIDPSPRFAGPDTAATRRRPSPCLVVLLRLPEVSAHDGCLWEEPVMSVGEVRTDRSGQTPIREVFGLIDDEVARIEMRATDEVVATGRIIEIGQRVDGRGRLFVIPYGDEPWVLRQDLAVVALDANGNDLRRVDSDFLGTFEARPADDRWR